MIHEIQQKLCLPGIRTEADFRAAAGRGYHAASCHLMVMQRRFPDWTVEDLAALHLLYFADLYPHAGEFRKSGDLAAFGGRIGADSIHIAGELDLLLDQMRDLVRALPAADAPEGVTARLALIAFVHARLALVHPFRDGNGRWARLLVAALEKHLLPDMGPRVALPKYVYMHALKALPADLGPLMTYHAEKRGLHASTLQRVPPPFPVQVTRRDR